MNTPFELNRYFYLSSFMAANKEFKPESFVMPGIEVRPNVMQNTEAADRWDIALFIGTPDNIDRTSVPYDFGISIFGMFLCEFPEDSSAEELLKFKRLFYVNASSMLYSAVRDHLLTLTALGPYGPFVLPTYRFDPEDITE